MEYKYFRWNVVVRIAIILVLGYAAVYVLTQTHFWLVSFWLALALVITLINLVKYVERSRRELAYFLLAIKQGDFTNTYHYKKQSDLNYAFHEINTVMKDLRNEKASNLLYLQTVVEHVRVAVLCFDADYKVQLVNKAARELFQRPHLTSVNSLEIVSPQVVSKIQAMESGERELIKVQIGGRLNNLSVLATTFKLKGETFKLVSFQDIKSELEEKELDSWQKLIRVLTHEIKNSVIPISTLSDVILQMIKDGDETPDLSKLDEESVEDLIGGLETIETRSKGLASFVTTYDQLTKLPQPEFQTVDVGKMIERVQNLFKPDLEHRNIRMHLFSPEKLEIQADPDLIDQILINLVKNAMEALEDQTNGLIRITAAKGSEGVTLQIRDNGPGISEEILENIFVPFYTTKESGSGIGLSLSRQIMRLHRGNITVHSNIGEGTSFELKF
ncbi:MAG: HAMP domain-containing histidine kinase [Roseivirga sp.]|nr:HAMP domain-containing histidine kinase [Roseivirga sp.]